MDNIKRIQLLTASEIADLYDRPDFNEDERKLFFALTDAEKSVLHNYKNVRTRVYFILQLGYFKAKQQFFDFDFAGARDDSAFILRMYFCKDDVQWEERISRDSLREQRKDILKLFNYRDWSTEIAHNAKNKLCELLRYYPKAHITHDYERGTKWL